MIVSDRQLMWLVWVLIAASVTVTWFSHQTSMKIAVLKERILLQHEIIAPLKLAQENRKAKDEMKWNAILKLIQDFSTKIRNKDLFLGAINEQVKQHVLKSKKNATAMAQDLFFLAEDIVVREQVKKEKEEGAEKIIQETRQFIKDFVTEQTPINVGQLYTYDKNEVMRLNNMDQENPMLVTHIRRKLWVTPSPRSEKYVLQNPGKMDRSEGQLSAFLDIFKNNSGGFFIECGALDGEDISNTLDMEERYNWTGALIEASSINFGKLVTKKRKAILIPACLSLEKHPTTVQFQHNHAVGKIFNASVPVAIGQIMLEVHCMPFYSIYKALGRREIDLFVLDIEGHEVEVLHTIPWDKVNILVIIAEFSHGKYSKDDMREFMFKQDYRLYIGTKQTYWPRENYIFIKKGCRYDVIHP